MLAIKKLQSLAKGNSSSATTNGLNSGQLNHYSSSSSLQSSTNLNSSLNSINSSHSTNSKSSLLHNNLYLPLNSNSIYGVHHQPYQEVIINTNRNSTKLNSSANVSPDGQSNNTSVNSNLSLGNLINQANGTPTTPELKTFQQLSTASTTGTTTSTTAVHSNQSFFMNNNEQQHHLLNGNGSISSSSNSLASSLNNSSNSASLIKLPPLLISNNNNSQQQQQYAYLNGNLNHQLINGHHQIINHQMMNNGNNLQPQLMMINRGRSMESLPMEPIYGIRQIVNGQTAIAVNSLVDGQPVQLIYANPNQLQSTNGSTNTIYLQQQQPQQQQQRSQSQQQHNPNEMYLILNNDMDGTATLNRPKNLIKNRPVAKIAAKTRDLNGLSADDDNSISEQKQAIIANQQIYGNLNGANFNNTIIANNMINTNLNNNGYHYAYMDNSQQIYENNAYIQQQQKLLNGLNNNNNLQERNSYIYATLKRNKKIPPPIPQRAGSIRSDQPLPQLPLTAPSTPSAHQPSSLGQLRRGSTNSLDDAQNLLNHQLNQLALAQKLKQQLNQRSSCSSLETMQEEAFATCVKSLTSRFSMNSSSLDDDDLTIPISTINSTKANNTITTNSTINNSSSTLSTSINNNDNNKNSSPISKNVVVNEIGKDELSATSTIINSPTNDQTKVSHNQQLANSLSSKLSIINNCTPSSKDESINLNHSQNSTGSNDFPEPPSPSLLSSTNDSSINELQHPKPTITPPLPPPPTAAVILNQQQQIPNNKIVTNSTATSTTALLQQHQQMNNNHQLINGINVNNMNNLNKTIAAQAQLLRQLKAPNNQIHFKFDNACIDRQQQQQQQFHHECTVSSSSSTESMPFANDNLGTMMRPRPNQMNCCNNNNVQQQLKEFASSSSSSSICSVSSITSSSTSSSSVSSNLNLLNNNNNSNLPASSSSSSLNNNNNVTPIIQNAQINLPPLPPPPTVQHQSSFYQSLVPQLQPPPQQHNINYTGNKIENAVRTSVNCISNLSNHLNLSKLITSNSATNTAFRSLLGKSPVQPPQIPAKPLIINQQQQQTTNKNWPCSPIKQLTSPDHVPNISQINNTNDNNQISSSCGTNKPVIQNLREQQISNGIIVNCNNEMNKLNNTIGNSNHDNFRSQQINLQSNHHLE